MTTSSGTSIDGRDRVPRPLGDADVPACLALTRAAGWNQTADDWRMMLERGVGWGIETADASALAASTVVLPFERPARGTGGGFAWISMVLVLPQARGNGLATRLLSHALQWLHARDTLPILDATPAGEPVYRRAGFTPALGLRRFRRAAPVHPQGHDQHAAKGSAPPPSCRIRRVEARDWPALGALDATVFGGDRSAILRALAGRMPSGALLAEGDAGLEGYVFARDGHAMHQVGPLVAARDATALALLDAALVDIPAACCVDLMDHRGPLQAALEARGFAIERPFSRMLLGAGRALPGDAGAVVLAAGPELG
ncbi:MAG: GNAT family N-acetyltransferase [Lautropia sp.]